MAGEVLESGAFDLVFAGNASGVLSVLSTQPGTGGFVISGTEPRSFVFASATYELDGNGTIEVNLAFISDDNNFVMLARGLPLTSASADIFPSPNQAFSLVLYNSAVSDSIYIPVCFSDCKWNLERNKLKQVETRLRFIYQNGYDNSLQLFYKRQNAALAAIVNSTGATWPNGY